MQKQNLSIHISAILLAAGASSRLGRPKQLVIYKSAYLVNYIAQIISETQVNEFSIVLGCNPDLISSKIDNQYHFIINRDWEMGMGSSISRGTEVYQNKADGLLVCLVDQYKLSIDVLQTCIDTFRENPDKIVACQYKNQVIGPPAIFPKLYFEELLKLQDDRGARSILRRVLKERPRDIHLISFPDGLLDIDYPNDLDSLKKV